MENNFYRKIVSLIIVGSLLFTSCGTTFKVGIIPMLSCVLQNVEITPPPFGSSNQFRCIVPFEGEGASPKIAIIRAKENLIKSYNQSPDTIFDTELYFNTRTHNSTIKGSAGYKANVCNK